MHMVQLMPLHPTTPSSLVSFKSRLVLPFWYWLTQVVPKKRPLNGCSSSSLFHTALDVFIDTFHNLEVCSVSSFNVFFTLCCICLQCFDAVGWAAGRASGL